MKRTPFSKKVSESYIENNLENTDIVSFTEYYEPKLKTYFYDELKDKEISGFPFASDFVDSKGVSYTYDAFESLSEEKKKECRLRFFYLPNYHELYIGTTGSGKTTGCIEPQIRAISSQKNKANLFITDPKGELFEHHARHLKENGYRLFILNFKTLSRSHCWNPLEEMYNKQMEQLSIGKGKEVCHGRPDKDLTLMGEESEFKHQTYIKYKGMAFPSEETYSNYIEVERYMTHSQVTSLINQFSSGVFHTALGDAKTWVDGARGFMNGILLSLLEEAIKPNPRVTKKLMTLKTVNDVFAMLRDGSDKEDSLNMRRTMDRYLSDKSAESMNKLNTVIGTADSTKKGFLSTFQTEVEKWMQGHIFQLTAETTISLKDDDKPWAIFVATRDYDKSDNVIAGLFIDWVYRQSLMDVERKRKLGLKPRHVHFLLDEFANIPMIPDFDNKISTARSRNLWFHLFVQSYDQLNLVYGPETANIIIDNCNEQVFLGSQSQETKERFSKQCGKKTVQSLEGVLTGQKADLVEVPVVAISSLDRIIPGEMYVKRIYSPVIKSSFIRSYQCANVGVFKNFYDTKAIEELVPINRVIPDDEEHTFEDVMPYTYFKQKQMFKGGQGKEEQGPGWPDDDDIDFTNFFKSNRGGKRS